jgi:hypothetical protein
MTGVSGVDSLRGPHPAYLMGTAGLAFTACISYSHHELGLVSIAEGVSSRRDQTKGYLLPNLRVAGKRDH